MMWKNSQNNTKKLLPQRIVHGRKNRNIAFNRLKIDVPNLLQKEGFSEKISFRDFTENCEKRIKSVKFPLFKKKV